MAKLTAKEIARMDDKTRKEKLKELRFELVKSRVSAAKSGGKTKAIKKAIARLLTLAHAGKTRQGETK